MSEPLTIFAKKLPLGVDRVLNTPLFCKTITLNKIEAYGLYRKWSSEG